MAGALIGFAGAWGDARLSSFTLRGDLPAFAAELTTNTRTGDSAPQTPWHTVAVDPEDVFAASDGAAV
jgi:hypothetical protein